jgi:Protein of unknown function (DUF3108)
MYPSHMHVDRNRPQALASDAICAGLAFLALSFAAATDAAAQAPPTTTAPAPAPAPANDLPLFHGSFSVNYRGINAGTTEIEMEREQHGRYRYESRANARGLFRAFFSEEITQISWLEVSAAGVRPLRYRADDGSDDTERDISLDFDWSTRRVTGVAEEKPVALEVEPGTHDAMSLQVAVMQDLAHGKRPGAYLMVDKDRVKEYRYVFEGEATIKTVLGDVPTLVYRSERTGSRRATRTWFAPSLGFIAVRAERLREGKREWLMEMKSLQRK